MKSTCIILICLVAYSSESQYFNEELFIKQIKILNKLFSDNKFEEATFLLADLYHGLNKGISTRVEVNRELKFFYTSMLDVAAQRLVHLNTDELFNGLLLSVRDEITKYDDNLLFMWRYELAQRPKMYIDDPYRATESFFRRQIATVIYRPFKSPAPLIVAVINGKGFCTIFDYADKGKSDDTIKFAKLLYLSRELSKRQMHDYMEFDSKLGTELLNLGKACKLLGERSLNDERRKAFLSAILDKEFYKPIASLEPYGANNKLDICNKLVLDSSKVVESHSRNRDFISLFSRECLDDLAKLPVEHDSPELQEYRALISRWFGAQKLR